MTKKISNPHTKNEEILGLLLQSDSLGKALDNLYKYFKGCDRKYSLSYFARRAGITSTGYLSDVMRGKRTLHIKYRNSIAKAFHLDGLAVDLMKSLLDREHCKDLKKMEDLTLRIDILKKNLRTVVIPLPEGVRELFFSLEVFSSFGLFKNRPTTEQLVQYFVEEPRERICEALETLQKLDLIGNEGEVWFLLKEQILFGEESEGFSHLNFIRQSLGKASEDLEYWFSRRDQSSFVSSIISVNREVYKNKLIAFKKSLVEAQNDFESGEANMIVRFNVQVFPVIKN